jgi:hypothetical protein
MEPTLRRKRFGQHQAISRLARLMHTVMVPFFRQFRDCRKSFKIKIAEWDILFPLFAYFISRSVVIGDKVSKEKYLARTLEQTGTLLDQG